MVWSWASEDASRTVLRPIAEDVEQLAAHNADAAELLATDRAKEAVPLFERTLAGCRAALGPDHPATLTVEGNLGAACVAAGRRRKGIDVLRSNLGERERVFGDDDPRTLTARDALAVAHRLSGNVDDAVEESTRVTARRRRVLGATHPDTLTSRMGLAMAKAAAGELAVASGLLGAAIDEAVEVHGLRHGHTVALLECGYALGLRGGVRPATSDR